MTDTFPIDVAHELTLILHFVADSWKNPQNDKLVSELGRITAERNYSKVRILNKKYKNNHIKQICTITLLINNARKSWKRSALADNEGAHTDTIRKKLANVIDTFYKKSTRAVISNHK